MIMQIGGRTTSLLVCYAGMQLILCKGTIKLQHIVCFVLFYRLVQPAAQIVAGGEVEIAARF